MNWLKKDALNRAWRTFCQAIGFALVASVGDLAYQVLNREMSDVLAGQPIDFTEMLTWTKTGLAAAVIMPILAYLHRKKLDPSPIPSATPPEPDPVVRALPDSPAPKTVRSIPPQEDRWS